MLYQGKDHVERLGEHRGSLDPVAVRDLIDDMLRLGFTDLEPEYPRPDSDYFVTDQPSCALALSGEHRDCRVIDAGTGERAPARFWQMADLVDALISRVKWGE